MDAAIFLLCGGRCDILSHRFQGMGLVAAAAPLAGGDARLRSVRKFDDGRSS
ncbi:hypothetical protein [Azospirillum endophyticum]